MFRTEIPWQEFSTMIKRCLHTLIAVLFLLNGTLFADGYLTVRTEPDGIEVWLDDNFVGDSPIIDKKLKSGRYSLKLVDPVQHSSTIEEIFIQDNENTVIEKTIKSKFGSLRVNSVPEGATVSIATDLGPTPVTNDFMNPGKYRVEIRHPDKKYLPIVEEVVIPRGESVSLSKTLEREKDFTQKDIWRLILGGTTAAGFVWAIIANGNYNEYNTKYEYKKVVPSLETEDMQKDFKSKRNSSLAQMIVGTVVGSLSLVGLEIVAFF